MYLSTNLCPAIINLDMISESIWILWHLSLSYHMFLIHDQLPEVFTLPGLIHMESMWNPWNPSPIPCGIHGIHHQFHVESMEWMLAGTTANSLFHGHHGFHVEWSWNAHGMVNSIWNPLLFHLDSTGFHGLVHMDSMEQVHMELMAITFTMSLLF